MKSPFKKLLPCVLTLLLFLGSALCAYAQKGQLSLEDAMRGAQGAGIPVDTLNRLLTLGYERQVDPESIVGLLGVLTQAQQEGFPLQPFVSKTEEGLIKRVPPSSIEAVLVKKLGDYRYMRQRVGEYLKKQGDNTAPPPEYMVRLTESLYAGVSREDLDRVIKQAPPASIPVLTRGVEVLASLKQARFDPSLSDQILYMGLKKNYFTPEQRDFARVISIARSRGISDKEIGASALSAIEKGLSARELGTSLGVSESDLGQHGPQVGGHGGMGHGGSAGHGGGMGHGGSHGGESGGHGGGSGGGHGGGDGGGSGGGGGGGCH